MDEYMDRLAEAQRIVEELLDSKRYDFDGLQPSDLEDRLPVVYAIFDKVDGACLYVGSTKSPRRRLYTKHLSGSESNARLKKYLIEDPNQRNIDTTAAANYFLIDQCYFQYLTVPDMRMRGQIEGLLSYLLDVRYIHEEH